MIGKRKNNRKARDNKKCERTFVQHVQKTFGGYFQTIFKHKDKNTHSKGKNYARDK